MTLNTVHSLVLEATCNTLIYHIIYLAQSNGPSGYSEGRIQNSLM
jgi:hypothetical protein